MRNRIARVTLGAGLLLLATAPLGGTAQATYCNPNLGPVCVVVDTVCLHGKLCQ
jgi:hypothetical protein